MFKLKSFAIQQKHPFKLNFDFERVENILGKEGKC